MKSFCMHLSRYYIAIVSAIFFLYIFSVELEYMPLEKKKGGTYSILLWYLIFLHVHIEKTECHEEQQESCDMSQLEMSVPCIIKSFLQLYIITKTIKQQQPVEMLRNDGVYKKKKKLIDNVTTF